MFMDYEPPTFWNVPFTGISDQQGNATAMANLAGNLLQAAALKNHGHADSAGPKALYWAVKHGNCDAPSLVAQLEMLSKQCAVCRASNDLRICSRCKAVAYCGKEHQAAHWKSELCTAPVNWDSSTRWDTSVDLFATIVLKSICSTNWVAAVIRTRLGQGRTCCVLLGLQRYTRPTEMYKQKSVCSFSTETRVF